MTTHVAKTPNERDQLILLIQNRKLPFTCKLESGAGRTIEQNKLQRLWCNEAAEQLGDEDAEDKRAYCKLHFGVPIMRMEDEDFAAAYDKHIKPLTYEHKLALMRVPLDFPVTRLMGVKQKTRYLDAMRQHFESLGVRLTIPESEG